MSLPIGLRRQMTLPAICAPMKDVSGPALVCAAAKAGIMAALPAHNAADLDQLAAWFEDIRRCLDEHREAGHAVGPLAVNVAHVSTPQDEQRFFRICRSAGVEVFISAFGDPTDAIRRAHDYGALAFHDVTTVRFAERAIKAGVDGLVAVGSGGGGHSGTASPLAFIPLLRQMFDGVVVMAGAVSNGQAIRAAEILGADLAYLGTRFIATQEASASPAYKQAIVSGSIADVIYTANPTGIPANWLREGLRGIGLDPDALPQRTSERGAAHLGSEILPWRDIGSAGQGIALITDIPKVAELVERLKSEYLSACRIPAFA